MISTGAPGEYYGVQGMTWRDPPMLRQPDRVRELNGRKLLLYYDGSKLRQVGLEDAARALLRHQHARSQARNARMLAIASSLQATEPVGPPRLSAPRSGLGAVDALSRRRARCCL